jgi:hypothetical protein
MIRLRGIVKGDAPRPHADHRRGRSAGTRLVWYFGLRQLVGQQRVGESRRRDPYRFLCSGDRDVVTWPDATAAQRMTVLTIHTFEQARRPHAWRFVTSIHELGPEEPQAGAWLP